jgi:hypothetical protein
MKTTTSSHWYATLGALLSLTTSASAQTYFGPVPYRSAADLPAGFYAAGHALEDFEDSSKDFALETNTGGPIGPGGNIDSVDGDDGVIDGFGTLGRSFFGYGAVTITFPAPVTAAGVVWTDGPPGTSVTFEAFGPGMASLGLIGPFMHADNTTSGTTPEDRFYGVQHAAGIAAIRLHSVDGNQSFELDHIQLATLGTSYCTPNPNSRGVSGIQTVLGSNVVARNNVTLVASRLPLNAFGYFLASRNQGFVANAGGSQGNLCLSGAVGRFNGNIFNTASSGSGTLHIDLQQIPSPSGLLSVLPGETWHFQTWHRDSVAGSATSNFTDAVSVTFS